MAEPAEPTFQDLAAASRALLSAEINRAIETLRRAGADPPAMERLDAWNRRRLAAAITAAVDAGEPRPDVFLRELLDGVDRATLARCGIV